MSQFWAHLCFKGKEPGLLGFESNGGGWWFEAWWAEGGVRRALKLLVVRDLGWLFGFVDNSLGRQGLVSRWVGAVWFRRALFLAFAQAAGQ